MPSMFLPLMPSLSVAGPSRMSHAAFSFLDDDLLALNFVRKDGVQVIIGCAKDCMQHRLLTRHAAARLQAPG